MKIGRKRGLLVRANDGARQSHVAEVVRRIKKMKLQKLIPVGILLLLSVATLSAQNALPNPHDDACWSSLGTLRACQIQAYDAAMDQAQRCTSYPEYQCLPADQPEQKVKHVAKRISAPHENAPIAVVSPVVAPEAGVQPGNSR
jgi:hypothetical protein